MSYRASWGTSSQGGEKIYYQDAQIMVSNARFQAGATMYPIRNISAVAARETYTEQVKSAEHAPAIACAILALVPVCFVGQSPWALVGVPVFGIVALVLALRAKELRWTETAYWVSVRTNGVDCPVYWTPDRSHRDAIVSALHQAIAGG